MGRSEKFDFDATQRQGQASIRLRRRRVGAVVGQFVLLDTSTLHQLQRVISRMNKVLGAYARLSVTGIMIGAEFCYLIIGLPKSYNPHQGSFDGDYDPSIAIRDTVQVVLSNLARRCRDLVRCDITSPNFPASDLRGIDKQPLNERASQATDDLVRTLADGGQFAVILDPLSDEILELPPANKIPPRPPIENGSRFYGTVTGYDGGRPILDSRYKLPRVDDHPEIGQYYIWESEHVEYDPRGAIRVIVDPAQHRLALEPQDHGSRRR